MPTPEISVVCSTYNRAGSLPGLLEALEAQTLAPGRFEVVIVDDGSSDGTDALLAAFAARTPLQFRCVRHPVNQGRSKGRNAGWRVARAPLVAFTDDDCVPDPAWLEVGLAVMSDSRVTILVGQTVPNPSQSANIGLFSRTQQVGEESGTSYMNTCNIFYRRSDLESVGGFDERFDTKGGEDTDLGWRVLDHGGSVAYSPDALVLHDITKGSFRAAVCEAWMWRDIPRVVARHPKRARPLLVHRLFWKASHEHVLLALASLVGAVALRRAFPLLGLAPWANYRLRRAPISPSRKRRLQYLPHVFAIDATELATMVRGSIKNRTFVL